jgi:5-methylcytosine-specific restriction endonuclease McrA
VDFSGSEEHVKRERAKARELRKSRWWQNLSDRASCYYCQQPLTKATMTMDHVVPLSQGGYSKPGNIVPACKPCNTRKRDESAVVLALAQEQPC